MCSDKTENSLRLVDTLAKNPFFDGKSNLCK